MIMFLPIWMIHIDSHSKKRFKSNHRDELFIVLNVKQRSCRTPWKRTGFGLVKIKHQCAISLLKNLQLFAGMHGVYFVMNSVDRRKWRVRHPSVWKLPQKEKTRGSFSILQMDGIQTDLDDPEANLCRKVMPG